MSSQLVRRRIAKVTWLIEPAVAEALEERLLARVHALRTDPRAAVIKDRRSRAVFSLDAGAGLGRLVVKQYKAAGLRRRLKYRFSDQAMREWRIAWLLAGRGFLVPEYLAVGVGRGLLLAADSWLIMRWADGIPLVELLRSGFSQPPWSPADRRPAMLDVGRLLGRLHESGVYCRDPRPEHMILRKSTGVEICLLDFNAAKIRGSVSLRRRGNDLAIMAERLKGLAADEDLSHVFKGYFAGEPSPRLMRLVRFSRRGQGYHGGVGRRLAP